MPSFDDLPFELVSEILSIAADLNARDPDFVTYSYGLSQASRPMQSKTYIQKYVRGRIPTDVLRWQSVDAIRQVNSRMHDWALSYALKELYIRRWQGGETWMKRALENTTAVDMLPVVYQNPYKSVKATANLFHDYPQIAQHVRKVWFNGIYRFDTIGYVFKILRNCSNVRKATIPWTALRYGNADDWNTILSFPRLTSLELLQVGLKNEILALPASHQDTQMLQQVPSLDFSNLRRLKIFGESNLSPLSDDDLIYMARTATKLEEILITNVSTITARGVAALVSASRNSLKLLEFIPLANDGFEPQNSTSDLHICKLLASCPRLQDLAITLPTCCPDLFANPKVDWHETIRVRVSSNGLTSGESQIESLISLLESARDLLDKKSRFGNELDIEIAVGPFLFDTKARLVHGSYKAAKELSEGHWTPLEASSVKGPYGYTGLYSGGMKGEWSAIGERDFLAAVAGGLIRL